MSLSCWNCRGAGKPATVRELRDFARQFAPMVLCIVETQLPRDRVENLASTLGYDNAYVVSSSGRSGGLGIFWNNEIKIENFGYSAYHIDAHVTLPGTTPWRLTVMYGESQVSEKRQDLGCVEISR